MSIGGSGGPLFGSGGYFHPQGSYGPWAGCGCTSILMVLAGIILVCAGVMHGFGGN